MQAKKIVILTGAGISAESGIKTFRDHNGLWEGHDVLDVASPQGFHRNPELVYQFYNERRNQLLSHEVKENAAHIALAKLQKEYPGEVILVTQNVDDLHERAGSENVIHMHGELLKMRCQKTGYIYDSPTTFDRGSLCGCCDETANLRPHIVWFGEVPMGMGEIEKHLEEADLFLSIGTSGVVYPAAMFVQLAKSLGQPAKTININLEDPENSGDFDEHFIGPASEQVPKVVSALLGFQ